LTKAFSEHIFDQAFNERTLFFAIKIDRSFILDTNSFYMSPKSPIQFAEIREEKKNLIMQTAMELFATKGYHAASISQIAKQAGISKGLTYNYFENKEALLKEIIFSGFKEILHTFDMEDGVLDTPEEMEIYINTLFQLLQDKPDFWRLYYSLLMQPEVISSFSDELFKLAEPYYEMMMNYFKIQNYEDYETETYFFGSLIDGIAMNMIISPLSVNWDKMKAKLIRMYCR